MAFGTYARTAPILSYVRSSGGYVAETADRKTAAGGASAQSALSALETKLAHADGRFPREGDCPACFGAGHFEVSIRRDGASSIIAGRAPFLFECTRCEGTGMSEDEVAEGHLMHEASDREAREFVEVSA